MTVTLPAVYAGLEWWERRAVRNEYVRIQEGKCHHCGTSLDHSPPDHITKKRINWKLFPPNFTKYPTHLHHSHDTGLTIGAVHALCNAVLWQYHGE